MNVLKDRVALITGGSSGIGRATALAFAREGARVVIAARGAKRGAQVVREIEAAGGTAMFVACDVSRSADVQTMLKKIVETYGRLDCAFNNAASTEGAYATLIDFSEEQFDRSVAIDLKGVWLCMKAEIQQMLGQDPPGGVIVNTSSINGLGGVPFASVYAAMKAGVLGLTKPAALEYATQGIRVNALVPGAFRTPMLETGFEKLSPGDPAAAEANYNREIPMKRIGRPEEAAEAVVWLCSDAASYVTGHSMIVDGGISAPLR